jgi:hypothetical protein
MAEHFDPYNTLEKSAGVKSARADIYDVTGLNVPGSVDAAPVACSRVAGIVVYAYVRVLARSDFDPSATDAPRHPR